MKVRPLHVSLSTIAPSAVVQDLILYILPLAKLALAFVAIGIPCPTPFIAPRKFIAGFKLAALPTPLHALLEHSSVPTPCNVNLVAGGILGEAAPAPVV